MPKNKLNKLISKKTQHKKERYEGDKNPMDYGYSIPVYDVNAGELKDLGITHVVDLPEVTVTGYAPLRLTTYYPVTSKYPYTGHSKLEIPIDKQTWYNYRGEELSGVSVPYMTIDRNSSAKDYNLITNNCADATLSFLNNAFGTSEKPWLFTTPGDVRDYALKELNGKLIKNGDGSDTVLIPRNAKTAGKLSTTALNMLNKDLRRAAHVSYKGPLSFNHTKPGAKKHPYKYQNGGKNIDSAKYFTLTLTEPNGKSEYQEHIDFGYTPETALSYARETEKRFVNAPNSGYIAGLLPEVVVTPGYGNATTLWHLLQMMPSKNKEYRKKFAASNRAGIISDNEYIDRMYELWKASKKPDWKTKKSLLYRPYYNVLTNTITAPAKGYLAELSHAYQFRHLFPDLNFNYLGLFGDIKIGGKSGYHRVNNPEYQAHSVIEPVLSDYAQGKINYKDIDPTIKKRLYKAKHSLK